MSGVMVPLIRVPAAEPLMNRFIWTPVSVRDVLADGQVTVTGNVVSGSVTLPTKEPLAATHK